jgi:hypothetical protein
MKCEVHEEGCGAYLQVGNLCYIDGSECTFIEAHYFIAVRLLNHLGLRSCKVGYVKVLCNQLHLLCNRIGVVSSILAKRDDKVYECSQFEEKEVALAMEEEDTNSVTVVEGQQTTANKKDKKAKTSKPPTKNRPNNLLQFHANMKEALAKNSEQTLHVVRCAFGIANLTMLDGGYPGSKPITSAERMDLAPDTDGDEGESEDEGSLYEEEKRNKKRKQSTSNKRKKNT